MEEDSPTMRQTVQWTGLVVGPVAAAVCFLLLPREYRAADGTLDPFSVAGRVTLAVMVWMGIWWLSEAINITVTALLPLVLFPILGAASMKEAAAPYADPLIFLFMGGFMLALSMQRWGLDKRIALMTLALVGNKPTHMIGGVMLATAVLSAFVSNTATTAMMLPIAVSVIGLVREQTRSRTDALPTEDSNFARCMLLGLAYAASIGGLATIIGTPTNAFTVAFLRESIDVEYRREVSFVEWLSIGLPVSIVFLPVTWLLLTKFVYPIRVRHIEGGGKLIRSKLAALGTVKPGEWITLIVFLGAAICWILRPLLMQIERTVDGESESVLAGLTDTGIAMLAALALFVIPVNVRQRKFTMDWQTATRLPWGILLLFGGGLSLAAAVQTNGVAEFIGSQAGRFAGMPAVLLVLIVTTVVIFLTELTSNTATTATLVPVLAALAPGLGIHPYLLVFPATIAASCAFMMPVATPPNAIVFGSGELTIPQMIKAGWWLNLIGIVLVTAFTMLLLSRVMAI